MSADVIARLESLLSRVVARRAEPRVAAPVAAPAIVAAPAPKAIEPEAPRAELRRPEAPKPEAATVEVQMIVPAEARPPAIIIPEVAQAPQPARTTPEPAPVKPAAPLTLDAPRAPNAPRATPVAPVKPAVADIAASFAAGARVSPGFDEDDADHVETLAFRMDKPLPRPSPVSIPPLPVSTPVLAREEPVERTAERFSPSLPPGAISAHVSVLPTQGPAASLRSLLQRSVAIRPRG